MEDQPILDDEIAEDLMFSGTAYSNLAIAANWAKLLAVMLFINTLFMIYQFFEMTQASRTSYDRNYILTDKLLLGVGSLLLIAFTFFAAYNLWGFASSTLSSLRSGNNKVFAISIESLKSYFKFYGFYLLVVATILIVILYELYRATKTAELYQ